MKFRPTTPRRSAEQAGRTGFTLVEVLAALAFMAIVIPVAVAGIRVAGSAGVVAERRSEAAQVADRILNEALVTSQGSLTARRGTLIQGVHEYRWQIRNDPWNRDALRLVSIDVRFDVQGREHNVRMSTLLDGTLQTAASTGNP